MLRIRTLLVCAVVAALRPDRADRPCGETCHSGDQVATINGRVPPGKPTKTYDPVVMAKTEMADGNWLHVVKSVRRAGTRAGIHIHKYGGHTCVLSGTITDFVEGHDPGVFPANTCYYMPPCTPMTAANLGSEDVVLIDTFILPEGEDEITFIEPDFPPAE